MAPPLLVQLIKINCRSHVTQSTLEDTFCARVLLHQYAQHMLQCPPSSLRVRSMGNYISSTVRDFQTYQQEMQCLRKELGDIRGIIAANNFPSHREAGPKHHANQPHILAYKLSNHSP
jgi:hypothetical protein